MRPEVVAGGAARLRSSFEVSRRTRVVYFDAARGILTHLTLGTKRNKTAHLLSSCAQCRRSGRKVGGNLEEDVAADVALLHLLLVHGPDVGVHLNDAPGGQHVLTLSLKVHKVDSSQEQNEATFCRVTFVYLFICLFICLFIYFRK